MDILEFINKFPNVNDFSRKSLVILFAYYLRKYETIIEFSSKNIIICFRQSMMKIPTNLTFILKELSKGKNSPLIKGSKKNIFSLSINGINEVESIYKPDSNNVDSYNEFIKTGLPYLKRVISKVNDNNRKNFLAEAISCLGVEASRATVILTWITVIDHLYEFIHKKKLTEFNNAMSRRTDKYGKMTILTKDDFCDIKESVFIEIARSANIITSDVRKILDEKLGIRNSAAHPSSIIIHETKVVNFIEDLIDNVVVKYPIN